MNVKLLWKPVLLPGGLCLKDGILWFIQVCGNQLMGVDINSFEIQKRFTIPCVPWGKDFFHRGVHDQIIDVGDSLLILLNGSDSIYAYDFSSNVVKKRTLLPNGRKYEDNAIVYKDGIIFFLPNNSNKLLTYNCNDNYWEEIKIADSNICMRSHLVMEGDMICSVDDKINRVYRYHISGNRIEEIKVGKKSSRYWGIGKTEEYFVLPHKNQRAVTLWNDKTGETYEITEFPEIYNEDPGWAYLSMHKVKTDILILPNCANIVLRVDTKNRKIVQEFPEILFKESNSSNNMKFPGSAYLASLKQDKTIYLYSVLGQSWHIIDIEKMELKICPQREINVIDGNKYISILFDDKSKKFFQGNESEFNCCNLNNFILSLSNIAGHCSKEENSHIGRNIWETLC